MGRGPRALLALLLGGLGACSHVPLRPDARGAAPLPAELRSYYAYADAPLEPQLRESGGAPAEVQRSGYVRRTYSGTSTSRGDEVQELVFDHYVPRQSPGLHPAVFLSEFLGGQVPEFIPRIFLEEGWQVLVMRWPEDLLDGRKGGPEVEETLLELVVNARRCLDWLCRQPGVDPERLASFGVSFGGIVNLVLAAVDQDAQGVPRFKYNAVALVGENLAGLLLTTEERGVLAYLRERRRFSGETTAEVAAGLARSVRSDPQYLAPYLDPARLLVFLARFDRTVPYENGRDLHHRLGEPELYVLPFGHYSFVLGQIPVPWIGDRLKEHFRARLDPAPSDEEAGGRAAQDTATGIRHAGNLSGPTTDL